MKVTPKLWLPILGAPVTSTVISAVVTAPVPRYTQRPDPIATASVTLVAEIYAAGLSNTPGAASL